MLKTTDHTEHSYHTIEAVVRSADGTCRLEEVIMSPHGPCCRFGIPLQHTKEVVAVHGWGQYDGLCDVYSRSDLAWSVLLP